MVIRCLHRLERKWLLAGGSLAGLLLAWTGSAALSGQGPSLTTTAQEQPAPQEPSIRRYLNKRGFRLPIEVNEQSRSQIKEIQLFVKEQPTAPWKMCGVVGPDQREFEFVSKRDGEFAFTMVTVDTQGRSVPADLRNEPPGVIVVVDTQAPQIELVNLGATDEGQFLQFDVQDANINRARISLLFQGGDKVFRPVEEVPGRANVYCVPGQAVFTGLLRASAEDMARNPNVMETHVNQLPTSKSVASTKKTLPAPEKVAPAPEKAPTPPDLPEPRPLTMGTEETVKPPQPLPSAVTGGMPVVDQGGRKIETKPAPGQTLNLQHVSYSTRPNGSEGPHYHDSSIAPPASAPMLPLPNIPQVSLPQTTPAPLPPTVLTPVQTPPVQAAPVQAAPVQTPPVQAPLVQASTTPRKELPKRQLINQNKVLIDYQVEDVGQSGIGKVEVWLTRDEGKNWTRHCEDASRKNAVEVNLPEDGVYGISLVVTNGRGAGYTPPVAGDRPQMMVEVDTARPLAQITKVQTTHVNGATAVQIAWTAHDKNFGDDPVELQYSASAQGPWQTIAKGLKSEGQHRWAPPAEAGSKTFLRLMVRDQAGNMSIVASSDSVLLEDPARPRGVIRGIRTELSTQQ